jgi:large repetitive protein
MLNLIKHYLKKETLVIILCFLIFRNSNAQLCSGTLGTPVFIENFGAGPNPGPALPAGLTNYIYSPVSPQDGEYTVSATSNPGNSPYWYNNGDHTGNPNGYMFVVNASYTPGEFYRKKIIGLCPNTTYVFSAWAANVNNKKVLTYCIPYVYSNITFQVEDSAGTVSGSSSSGNLPIGATNLPWTQYGFVFTTGQAQTSASVVLINSGPGGCGNDLAIDDISLRPCGPTASISVTPYKPAYCVGDSIQLTSTLGSGYTKPVYQWQFSPDGGITWTDIAGATSKDLTLGSIKLNQEGSYRLLVAESGNISSENCRIHTNTVTLVLKICTPLITINGGTLCPPDSCFPLSASVIGGKPPYTYTWSNSKSGPGPVIVCSQVTSTYTLTVTDSTGASAMGTATVTINPKMNLTISKNDANCLAKDGKACVSVGGGAPPFTYSWAPSGDASSCISVVASGVHEITVTDKNTCTVKDSVLIKDKNCTILIPNIFTPGGNGYNSHFVIKGLEWYPNSHLVIYNRWGLVVLRSSNYQNNWDGTNTRNVRVPDGVYYYILHLSDQNTSIYTGFITVVSDSK